MYMTNSKIVISENCLDITKGSETYKNIKELINSNVDVIYEPQK